MKKRTFQLKHRLPMVLASISLMGVLAPAWAVSPASDEGSGTQQRPSSQVSQPKQELDSLLVSRMLSNILFFLDPQKVSQTAQACQRDYDAIWKDPAYDALKDMLPQNFSAREDLEALPSLNVCGEDAQAQEGQLAKKLLSFLPKLDGVKRLRLWGISASAVKYLAPYLPSGLTTLELENIDLDRESVQALAQHMPKNLETLSLKLFSYEIQLDNELTQVFVSRLPKGLEELKLYNVKLDGGSAVLLMNGLPRGIEDLSLSGANLNDTAINALAKQSFERLRHLRLGDNQISPEGAKTLVKAFPQISLALSKNPIGNEGAVAIVRNLPPTFQGLDLNNTGLKDEGALLIADLLLKKGLPFLNKWNFLFANNPISWEVRDALKKVLERDAGLNPNRYFDAMQ